MENQVKLSKEALELFVTQMHTKEESVSAVLVVKSKKTGNDFTFHIRAKDKGTARYMAVSFEDGYNKYNRVHYIINNVKKKVDKDIYKYNLAYAGAVWLLNTLHSKDIEFLLTHVDIYNTGACIKCNRVLTDLDSIQFGMGKTCRGK